MTIFCALLITIIAVPLARKLRNVPGPIPLYRPVTPLSLNVLAMCCEIGRSLGEVVLARVEQL